MQSLLACYVEHFQDRSTLDHLYKIAHRSQFHTDKSNFKILMVFIKKSHVNVFTTHSPERKILIVAIDYKKNNSLS